MAMPVDSISPVGEWEREGEEEREEEGEDTLNQLPDNIRERLVSLNQERYVVQASSCVYGEHGNSHVHVYFYVVVAKYCLGSATNLLEGHRV